MQKTIESEKLFSFSDLVVEEVKSESRLFGLLIGIVVFSSASEGGSYIHTMGDEE